MSRWWVRRGASGLACVAVVCVALYVVMNARTFQLAGQLVSRVATEDKVVALTFDDGPSPHVAELLDLLAEVDVRATFYLNGRDLQRFPHFGAAIAAAGHEIGNHSFSHRRMVLVSPATVAAEIEGTDAQIRATGYTGPITFRPPYGKKLWTLPRYLAEHGRTTVMWDVEPDSADEQDATTITRQAVDATRPGSIILLHVMFDGRDASRAAVSSIINGLRDRGYDFLTVSDLLRRGR
ncbi:polysaccharide deacetylase family protein [Mycolicibacterium sp. S2-37]|uniref:polysaccharide deacetylase family protein n=1 Tax=Mycolicibacterium sp. S2-37 TaxID=2810297 RepID=UPI001A94467A|nr:polysaccharide deacetylase family protein [Mycolicibacterium sp. S2-37]MBO0678808.1 polysaccharide deacetylase family protein [Mycolicibacterium sp. S2-37]